MPSLLVFAFISPVFGLQLELDTRAMTLPPLAPVSALDAAAQLEVADDAAAPPVPADDAPAPATTEATAAPTAQAVAASAPDAEPATAPDAEATPAVDVGAEMARRARYARVHKWMGITTWAAMTSTVVMGTLQYANLYGFFDSRANTRCVRGGAFFGDDACVGTPVPHLTTSLLTGALYYTTFGLSVAMPDPIGLDQGDSESARRLRQHKRLRWAHFTGMAVQTVFGMFIANPGWMGLDRANDYRALQALATMHMVTGYTTYGLLTYAGARMAF